MSERVLNWGVCPDCKNANIRRGQHHLYCGECGLVLNEPSKRKHKNKGLSKQAKSQIINRLPIIHKKSCLTCKSQEGLTKHHIIPKRTGLMTKKAVLCRVCHNIADLIADSLYYNQVEIKEENTK